MRSNLLVLALSPLVGLLTGKAVLEDNGYRDLVVAISPDVPESQDTLAQIKGLMTEASRELFIATRKRAYYQRIKILLPQTWTQTPTDQDLQGEFYEAAEVRVDLMNPVYQAAPYTVRGSGCGEPGSYIHITPGQSSLSRGRPLTPPLSSVQTSWWTVQPTVTGARSLSTSGPS